MYFMTNGSLMKVESIPECSPGTCVLVFAWNFNTCDLEGEHSAMLVTCIKRYFGLENQFLVFLRAAVLHSQVVL